MSHQTVKYTRLSEQPPPDEEGEVSEPTFNFATAFNYATEGEVDPTTYNARNDYGSAFTYRGDVRIRMEQATAEYDRAPAQPAFWLVATSWVLTCFSYIFFVLTIPVSYWVLVKKMGDFDRLVVFRLGKMIGVKGPGRFVVFPWMDRTKRIDVRAAAFSVPPQQFITADGGIVEMGAEIQYGIVDVVTMIREVADHQDILRSLGKTLLVKILVKKGVHQLERDKRTPESEILDEINAQVRKWGINVHSVALSETKVLKQPESGSNSAVGSILKGLGVKSDPKFPSPQEFIRSATGGNEGEQLQPTASLLGDVAAQHLGGSGGGATVNMSLLQSLSSGSKMPPGANQVQLGPGIVAPPSQTPPEEFPANWGKCLEVILSSDVSSGIEQEALGLYRLEISETEAGQDVYYIEVTPTKRSVSAVNPCGGREPDVSVSISSPDLANVLDGSLAPLQAYLTGRISASGDVRKLMFFDKLSRRGHKPGSMFTV